MEVIFNQYLLEINLFTGYMVIMTKHTYMPTLWLHPKISSIDNTQFLWYFKKFLWYIS